MNMKWIMRLGQRILFCSTLAFALQVNAAEEEEPEQHAERQTEGRLLKIQLLVQAKNSKGGDSFFSGQPIYFRVLLSNKTAEEHYDGFRLESKGATEAALREGKKPEKKVYVTPGDLILSIPRGSRGWAGAVDLLLYRKEETNKSRKEVLAGSEWPELVTRQTTLKAIEELGERPLSSVWCIPPKYSSQLSPGTYELVARYNTSDVDNARIVKGDLVGVRDFRVVKPTDSKEAAVQYACVMTRYHLKKKEWDKAIDYAKKALSIDESYDSHLTYYYLAKAYDQKESWKDALVTYEKFLKHHPDSGISPYPSMVRQRIQVLRQKLKQ